MTRRAGVIYGERAGQEKYSVWDVAPGGAVEVETLNGHKVTQGNRLESSSDLEGPLTEPADLFPVYL